MFCFVQTARTLVCVPLGTTEAEVSSSTHLFRIRYSRRDILVVVVVVVLYFVMPPVLRTRAQAPASSIYGTTRLDLHAPASVWLYV